MPDTERISVAEYRRLIALSPKSAGKPSTEALRGSTAKMQTRSPVSAKAPLSQRPEAILGRLMRRLKLHNLKLQPEERLAVDFADTLRTLVLAGRLHAVWTHPANEIAGRRSGLSKIRYTIAKCMGLIDGAADYLFLWADGSGALEAKVGKFRQQENQKDFQFWCEANGVRYEIFTSVDQGIEILTRWGIIR